MACRFDQLTLPHIVDNVCTYLIIVLVINVPIRLVPVIPTSLSFLDCFVCSKVHQLETAREASAGGLAGFAKLIIQLTQAR